LEFSDDIRSIEFEAFSIGPDINVGMDMNLCVECESFSFDPIIIDLLFEFYKLEFVESANIVTENFDLDQTLVHFDIK